MTVEQFRRFVNSDNKQFDMPADRTGAIHADPGWAMGRFNLVCGRRVLQLVE